MVDEDCGELKYCLYEIENSKCLPCIPTDMVRIELVLLFGANPTDLCPVSAVPLEPSGLQHLSCHFLILCSGVVFIFSCIIISSENNQLLLDEQLQ